MAGHMRGDAWQLLVHAGRDPATGKKRYVSRTVKGPKREAETALAALVTEVARGAPSTGAVTVGELLDAWFEHAKADFSPSTVLETAGYVKRNLKPRLGSVPLDRLRSAELDRFYRQLLDGSANDGRPLAPGTIRRIHGILRRALDQGVRWGWIGHNYAADASPPRVPASELRPPSPNEIARLFRLAEAEDPTFATFLVLAAATGARRGELAALRWDDIDVAAGSVTIRHGLVLGPEGLVEKGTKTHAVRTVSLDRTTVAALEAHRGRCEEIAGMCEVRLAADAFVFSNEPNGSAPLWPSSLSRSFRRLCTKAGVSGVRLHDVRHFVASQLLAGGVDVRTVAGRLGHRNASTTLNVYAHFLPEADREASTLLERLLGDANAEG